MPEAPGICDDFSNYRVYFLYHLAINVFMHLVLYIYFFIVHFRESTWEFIHLIMKPPVVNRSEL